LLVIVFLVATLFYPGQSLRAAFGVSPASDWAFNGENFDRLRHWPISQWLDASRSFKGQGPAQDAGVTTAVAAVITVTDASGGTGAAGGCKLRDAITAANTNTPVGGCAAGAGADTIALPANAMITLDAVDNTQFGPNGLPAITSQITIQGNGATIQRDPASASKFRLFAILSNGNLTLQNVTVKNGLAQGGNGGGRGGGGAGLGGAIFNQGTLLVEFSALLDNTAQGGAGGAGASGGGGGGLGGDGGANNGGGGGFFGAGGSGGGVSGAGGGGGGGTIAKGSDNNGSTGGGGGDLNGGGGGNGGANGAHNTVGANDGGKGGNGTAGSNGGGGPGAGAGAGGGGNGGNGGDGGDDGGAGGNGGKGGEGSDGGGGGGGGNGGAGGNGGTGIGNEGGAGGAGAAGGKGGFGGGGGGGGLGGLKGTGHDSSSGGDGGEGGDGGFGGGGGAGAPGGGSGGSDGRDGNGNAFGASGFNGEGGGGAGMGGAIFSNGGTLTVRNSTLSGNAAIGGAGGANVLAGTGGLGLGGGIFVRNGMTTINNATLNNNDADFGGSLYTLGDGPGANGRASLILRNSILDGTPNGDPDCRVNTINSGSVNQTGSNNNLIDTNSTMANACSGVTQTDDAGLAALAFNGGISQTHAITTGSPAYNNGGGNCEATDQRGVIRPQAGACDIGAYELSVSAPTVAINQAAGQVDPTNASPINFSVVFSEPVSDFTGSDISFADSTVGGKLVATVTGGGANYNVAVSGMTSSGLVVASIPAGAAVNNANNGNTASNSVDNMVTFDNVAPTVTIDQAAGQADPTNASPINFTVVFSKPVTGFATGDVTLSGGAGATTAIVSGSGTTYNVAVSGMTNAGSVIATIGSGKAADAAGNGNAASTSKDNTVTFDNVAPTVTINQASGQADPTSASPINFTVVFSKPVTGFVIGDVTLSGSAGATIGVISGGGMTYNVAVSGMTADGTVVASIAAGRVVDAAGNGNAPSTSEDNTVTFRAIKPTMAISLADPAICTGPGGVVAVSAQITNSSASPQAASFTATLPSQLLAVPGSCATDVGTCTVVNPSTVIWTGSLNANQKAQISYRTQIADDTPTGTNLCVTSMASLSGGSPVSVQACATVNCPPVGPGALTASASEISDQKAGSVLIYNIYTSSATTPNSQNTRINLTNTDVSRPAMVHLYFLDGESCSVADSYICLTPNQTSSFLMSDIDPGVTGYLVAVAVDRQGCPIDFNRLIGDAYVKFSTGHAANLAAESIAAIAGGLMSCNVGSMTARLNFDGVTYNRLPRALALDNIPSRADGNDTLLVLNRIGGHLGVGAATLNDVFGVFYNDVEVGVSFSFNPRACQFRSIINNNFPRITPRFEQFVPAGHSGWLRIYSLSDQGILGAVFNLNTGSVGVADAFNQGRNLHKVTLSSSASYTIPLFPPNC
jgi:hypothetical protein